MNLANKLTSSRIILTFIFIILLFSHIRGAKVAALVVFLLACVTDYYDGKLARALKIESPLGKLLDPIADKILVLAAFLSFVEMALIPAWMVIMIFLREALITGLRLFATTKDRIIPAADWGKQKTASQMAAIFLVLIYLVLRERYTLSAPSEGYFHIGIITFMWLTVLLTLVSGVSYIWANRDILK